MWASTSVRLHRVGAVAHSCRCRSSALRLVYVLGTLRATEVSTSKAICHGVCRIYCRLCSRPFGRPARFSYLRVRDGLFCTGGELKRCESLKSLDFERAEAEKDVLRPIETERLATEVGVLEGLHLIFTPQYRLQTCLAVFILSFIQLSGIDGVLYVSFAKYKDGLTAYANPTSNSTPQRSSPKPVSRLKPPPSSHPACPPS